MESSNDSNAATFRDLLESTGLTQHVKDPTHRNGHTLDLLIDRQEDEILSNLATVSDLPSDHNAVLCTIAFPKPKPSKIYLKQRSLRSIDMNAFNSDILNSRIHSEMFDIACSDVNSLSDQYDRVLRELIDKHAPERIRSITLRPNTPWFNDSLRALKRQRRQCERKYKSTRLEVHRQIYIDSCKVYTTAINSAKSSHYKNLITNSDQKELFQMIDSLFKVKPVSVLPTCTSQKSLAEDFSNYFSSKIQKLRDNLQNTNLMSMNMSVTIDRPSCQCSFGEFTIASDTAIENLLMHCKPKSCALDPIPTQVVKLSVEVLTGPITKLINASLTSGVFPASLKKGIIRPSIKKQVADHELFPNYRPITNIAFLSKVLERIVATQTTNYLAENHLLAKFQSAYRCYHSTETALLRVFNDILSAIDNNQEVVLVLLDLSSAFDTIDHTLLLDRLHHRYGISGTVLKWFQSYLTNRTQSVRIKDAMSTDKALPYGIPQGSVLGPFLFSLFFAPLQDVILAHDLNVMMYADDTQLYISIGSLKERQAALSKLELCINDILIWCTTNGLACNPDKTEIIHFTSRFSNHHETPEITIMGSSILAKLAVRNLGVTMDKHLQLTKHINNICKSAFFAIRSIGRIRKHLDRENCERLVHAFVSSKLDSCNGILVGLPDNEITKLQHVQNAAARLVTGVKKYDHITPVLQCLHWLPVKARMDFKILLLTYKALHNLAPEYIRELIVPYKPLRSLRSTNQHLLVVPNSRTKNYGDRTFAVASAKLWNSIPLTIRKSDTVASFKSSLKTYLFEKHFII